MIPTKSGEKITYSTDPFHQRLLVQHPPGWLKTCWLFDP